MDRNNKRGTWLSLLLHLLLLIGAVSLKSVDILVPSRSDGMEVELLTPSDLIQLRTPEKPSRFQIQNTNNADVNIKQPDTTPIPPKPQGNPKIKNKKTVSNKQINDLLNNLTPSENAGNSQGTAAGGSNMGTSDTANMLANYADLVIARVRPYVIIPDGISPSARAVVEVTLLPNMQVYNVQLISSSGNSDYDNNIQQAINRVQTFPPLPDGANFTDFRKIRLTFRPE